ncbi:MAG: cell division protein FtsA [Bacteroidales bacterium]|nr:cell division protein FtsA [Bacteroidales bacterium]
MGVDKNIVAIELGSSGIRAMIGQKRPDGSLQIVGFEKESAPDSVHKGVVYNIDKTIQAISAVIKRIEERQKVFVNGVYVGITGQSLRTVGNSVRRQFDVKVSITDEIVEGLKAENNKQDYPGAEILDVVPQEFRVGIHQTNEPSGIISDRVEGCYKNIIARTALCEAVRRCLSGAKLEERGFFIAPLLLSDYLLTDAEKRSGCALVDFGAETTTVAVYEKNILRHLVVIPLGGNNITNDIASILHIEHEEAEALKRTYGSAYTEDNEGRENRMINISNDRQTDERRLLNIIEARQQEIIDNVWEQLNVYTERLLSGIIFTGGAANMRDLEKAFNEYHHFEKIKTRQLPTSPEFNTSLKLDPQTNTLATLVAMLRRGDEECTSEKPMEPDLFDKTKEDPTFQGVASGDGDGIVKNNKTKLTEPADGDNEETPAAETKPQEDSKPKKPNMFSRMGNWFRETAGKLVEE